MYLLQLRLVLDRQCVLLKHKWRMRRGAFTCHVDQEGGRFILFASQCGDTQKSNDHRHTVHDLSGNGPASLVVPCCHFLLQIHGVLRGNTFIAPRQMDELKHLTACVARTEGERVQTARRVTFRSGTVTRQGTTTWVEKRLIKIKAVPPL